MRCEVKGIRQHNSADLQATEDRAIARKNNLALKVTAASNDGIVILLASVVHVHKLALDLAICTEPVERGDGVAVLGGLRITRVTILDQVRLPFRLSVVSENRERAVEGRVHDGVVLVDPGGRFAELVDVQDSRARLRRACRVHRDL